tara:strand:+ start:415 stop:783 length:369 start_codon:yes stop_codon:yes gene_type:complete
LSKKIYYSLKLKDITIFGFHGLYKHEKESGQNFLINLIVNYYPININDDIKSYINYISLYNFIKEKFNANRYDTLESLINQLIIDIEKKFKLVFYIKLSIEKPELNYDNNQNFIHLEREFLR